MQIRYFYYKNLENFLLELFILMFSNFNIEFRLCFHLTYISIMSPREFKIESSR